MKKLFSLLTLALLTMSAWAATTVTDVITAANLTATGTSYTDFSGVTITSDAVYAGQSAKNGNGAIQLRSKNSNSGIVSTTSGGKLVSIKIEVESGTNTIDVYGNTNAYTAATDLYATGDNTNQGTKLGSLSESGTITVDGDYQYVGIRSNNGAVYIASIEITWETEGGVTPPDPTYNEVGTLAAVNALADTTEFKFTGDAVVTYHNGKYMFLRDNTGYGLIYSNTAAAEADLLANGVVLNQNWTATKVTYRTLVEYTGAANVAASGNTDATLAAAQDISALDANLVNAYVKLNNVKSIVKSGNNYSAILANGDTVALYNRFNKTIPEFTDQNSTIIGIVSIFDGNLQLYFIESNYEAPIVLPTEVANIAAANQVATGNQFTFTGNAVVAYKHGNQLWLRDATGSAYAYQATDSTIAQGTVIAPNWGATVATYNDKPEYTNLTDFVASGTQEVLPYEYQTITLDNYAEYVIVKGLKFVSTSTSGSHDNYVTEDGLTVRDNFDILKGHYDENATYDITGVVTAYNGAVQLYITDYEAIVGVAMPIIEPDGGTFTNSVEVTITCATEGADIYYMINDGDEILYNGPFTLTETATVKAYADLDGTESSMATATFTKVEDVTYTLVTDGAQLADGDKIILVSTAEAGDAYAMGAAGSNNFGHAAVTITEDKTITTHEANVITLGKVDDNWTLLANEGYLYAASSTKNWLKAEAEVDDNAIAQIVVSDSAAVFIQFQGANSRNILRYNPNESNNNPLFSCYNAESSIQNPVYIFKAGAVEPQGLRGDVDLSEEVTIADVSALIDYLLTGDATGISLQNADCDLSGNGTPDVTIADVSALIDYLLNNAW